MWKFLLDKNSPSPYLHTCTENCANAIKVAISGSSMHRTKISDKMFANESGGEISKNFILAKIFMCTVSQSKWCSGFLTQLV